MAFPRKFKEILEPDAASVPRPDYLWLTYAACGCDAAACGWTGWITEAVFRRTSSRHPTSTGDELLDSQDDKCPRCGRELFRTEFSIRFEPSADQWSPVGEPRVDSDVGPMEYE